ncbi:MAG: class I SAM-dependent methyltransferase [Candidatus Krumholzibacteriia bacterium]
MSRRTLGLGDDLQRYLQAAAGREPPPWRRLREETARLREADMQIAPEQGQFMALLVEMLGARRALEVGTFTGYSALWIASALPADGRLICCDVSEEWTAIARRHWREAGLADRIDLRLGPALATLDALVEDGAAGAFDFAFLDADKQEYDAQYERCLVLLRSGGVVAVDNALDGGRVVDPGAAEGSSAAAVDALNRKLRDDRRVSMSLVPIADGLLLARKR